MAPGEGEGRRWRPVPSPGGAIDFVPQPFTAAGPPDSVVEAWTRLVRDNQAAGPGDRWDWGDRPGWDDATSSDGDRAAQAPGQAPADGPPPVVLNYAGHWRAGAGGSWVYWSSTPGQPDIEYVRGPEGWVERIIGWPGPTDVFGTDDGPAAWIEHAPDPRQFDQGSFERGVERERAARRHWERPAADRPSPSAGWGITGRTIQPGDITSAYLDGTGAVEQHWPRGSERTWPGAVESVPRADWGSPDERDPAGHGSWCGPIHGPWCVGPGPFRLAVDGPPVVAFRWRQVGRGWVRDVPGVDVFPPSAFALDLDSEQPAFVLGPERVWAVDPAGFAVSRVACERCARRDARVARWSTVAQECIALAALVRWGGAAGDGRQRALAVAAAVGLDAAAAVWAEAEQDATAVRHWATGAWTRARRAAADAVAALQESPDWGAHVWVERTTGRRLDRDQWHAISAWVAGVQHRHGPRWWGPFGHGDVDEASGRDDPSTASQPDGSAGHGDESTDQATGRGGVEPAAAPTVHPARPGALGVVDRVAAAVRRHAGRPVQHGSRPGERAGTGSGPASTGGDEQGPGRRSPVGQDAADDAATGR